MNVQQILVPVDFSACSPALVSDAVDLAQRFDASLVLLNVVEAPEGLSAGALISTAGGSTPAFEALENEARERLERFDTKGVEVKRVTWRGRPVESILEAVTKLDVDLVAMGTHGRKGFAHVVLGSVAERVVRECPVPVLTIRSLHRPSCDANSCNWCQQAASETREQVSFEADG